MAKTRRAFREFDRLGKGRITDKELEAGLLRSCFASQQQKTFSITYSINPSQIRFMLCQHSTDDSLMRHRRFIFFQGTLSH